MSDIQSFATLGNPVGFVSQLSGTVSVQSIDGQERVLSLGDPIYFGETVVAAAEGSATIGFTDGTEIFVSSLAAVEIDEQVFNFASVDNASDDTPQDIDPADNATDIAALQQAILEGQDPTLVQEAPAAGEEAAADGGAITAVDIERTDASATPEFGFDTQAVGTESAIEAPEENDPVLLNTAAAIAGPGEGAVTEDTILSTGGALTIDDPDAGDESFNAQTNTAGDFGTFNINAAGVWTYDLNNDLDAVQELGEGDTLTETFTVTSSDGTASTVTITINGTNDVPTFGTGDGVDAGEVTEDAALTTSGILTIDDVDAGEETFAAQTGTAGNYGSFSIATNGAWTYTLDNDLDAVQSLGEGDTLTETFTVTSADGTQNSVTVTINGTNDAPVATAATAAVQEDASVSGTVTASDVDLPAGASLTFSTTSTATGLTFNSDGTYTFDASSYD
ncbi:retention module-containing protein, partial [Marinomonas ostreistagni]|uniref:retention module-containing protein n=1 Tax=Marinomonas ostreistagni TaxID=359209 RepID=UPI00194FE284